MQRLSDFEPLTASATLVSMKREGSTLTCLVPDMVTLNGGEVPESWRAAFGGDESAVADFTQRCHVTLSSGKLGASSLIDVARWVRDDERGDMETVPRVHDVAWVRYHSVPRQCRLYRTSGGSAMGLHVGETVKVELLGNFCVL